MLFNSFEFIFLFLPIAVSIYFYLNKKKLVVLSKVWLVLSSLFYYSWWNVIYLPLMLSSIIINYGIGLLLSCGHFKFNKKFVLFIGICINIGLLGYFKYADFFISNINSLTKSNIPFLNISFPLAISFFTFQQIAYIVDSYRKETSEFDFLNYALFVTFFPQLIAGPIVHHKEMMPQFGDIKNKIVKYKNQALGIFIFSIGLFKKVILADTFAAWATQGFDHLNILSLIEGWVVSLSYTFQIYFDFSGYTDMAMGAALLFNIILPMNFNSPYKSLNIQEVWDRWHITLGRFLYRYIYIPLNKFMLRKVFMPFGLKRYMMLRTNLCLLLLFLISGFWHGAGWTFIFWGFLHGAATITHRYWKSTNFKMNKILAWILTFNFINFSLVFFRAVHFGDAIKVLKGMFGFNGIILPSKFINIFPSITSEVVTFSTLPLKNVTSAVKYILLGFFIILCLKNTVQLKEKFHPTWYTLLFTFVLFLYSILHLTRITEFLYFNF
ncbi:MBOAT family O-acyltransferase [Petroclostridium sp. X23]|uniref:MBOAT family O-acyltransferase n=1 Tax=Petroclostridium sp. X23 TaxID=3045146 RepID=UPI0024AD6DAA|nr:MBOAT family O-acyltransferase [Petroclostridium sp. X23]WHH57504.1 MBOAT family O-acyltransferase [Petroclostridium sp. X23]